ncbi:MAG: LysM peptidoglycan-binding domain-containing protein [Cyanobacteriota bacterium]|nr:LysM peptidoglycan-binding domain-containing protein [Cyanobacteriota bacterium]
MKQPILDRPQEILSELDAAVSEQPLNSPSSLTEFGEPLEQSGSDLGVSLVEDPCAEATPLLELPPSASPPLLKPALAGFAVSISMAGLLWLQKPKSHPIQPDCFWDPWQDEPNPTEDLPNTQYRSSRWVAGLAMTLGVLGLWLTQKHRLPPEPPLEMVPVSSQTLSAVLQQNFAAKREAASAALKAGQLAMLKTPSGIIQHEVKAGETLWKLTQMYQIDAAAITISNGITATTELKPGETLYIPGQAGLIHTVAQGDTLESLAIRYQVRQRAIIQATPLTSPDFLSIGQKLLIPGDVSQLIARQKQRNADIQARAEQAEKAAAAQRQAALKEAQANIPITHTVASGDTIERIAARYQISQQAIIRANRLQNPHWLELGQKLVIPTANTPLPVVATPKPVSPAPVAAKPKPKPVPATPVVAPPPAPPVAAPPPAAVTSGFVWPVAGQITSGFGWRNGRIHAGVDIPGPVGSPIVAVMEGTIIFAGYGRDGYGNRVDIRHPNGLVTRYAHGNQIYVTVGQYVQQGQTIMSRGSTGWSTGPHLHFEVRPGGGAPVDPRAYLR